MRFCLNTSTIKPQPYSKIQLAGQAGYDRIELWVNDVYDFIGRGREVHEVEQTSNRSRANRAQHDCHQTMGRNDWMGISTNQGRGTSSIC